MSNQGRFIWYELMSTDPKAALNFYSGLTGWSHKSWDADYDIWMIGDRRMAGCFKLPSEAQEQGAPTHWVGYIHCDDVDATKAKAIELGATELISMDLPEVGRFSMLHDPQHAVIALFQPADEPAPEQDAASGHFSWHELMAADYEAAFSFYSELFGWEIMDDMDMGELGIYRLFGRNGKQMGGMFNKPPEVPVASWLYYVNVPDVDESAAAITAAGGKIVNGPMEVPDGGRIVQAMDPQGGMFALHTAAAAEEE